MQLELGELRSALDVELFALRLDLLQRLFDGLPIPAAVAGAGDSLCMRYTNYVNDIIHICRNPSPIASRF